MHQHHSTKKRTPTQPTGLAGGGDMISSSAAAISSAPSSTLSPHAAPFTLPARPPGRRQDGDVSRSMDEVLVMYGEDKRSGETQSMSPIECAAMESHNTIYAVHAGQTSSWTGFCMDVHPSSTCSSSGMVSAPSVGMTSNYKHQNSLTSRIGRKCSTLKIEHPPNKASETDKNSCSLRSKLVVITENIESNKETAKDISFPRNISNPHGANENTQGPTIYKEEVNSVFNVKPLHIPTKSVVPRDLVADDLLLDPSECSVDSPCWRGASSYPLSPFDAPQTSAPHTINQELEVLDIGREQSSSTVRHHEAPAELQSLATSNCKNKHNQSQGHLELGVLKNSGDIGTNQSRDSHGKKLQGTNQIAAKCTVDQKQSLQLKGNCMKQSGLNSAAPDFVPSSIGKSNIGKGSCTSKGRNILGIFKAIQSLTEVLQNSYPDDGIELEEHDYILFESVIGNLQNCLRKTRKGPIKGVSDKAELKAPHSQTTVLKSDVGKYNGSYIVDGGKGKIVNNFAGSSRMLNNSQKNILTRPQPSPNNFSKNIPCEEEHSQVLVYKNLWVDAERANCELKYQLKDIRVKINPESSMANAGGPRNNHFQVSDFSTNPISSYGAALANQQIPSFTKNHPTKETLGARNSQNLLYAGDCIQSGGNSAHSCSSSTKGHATSPVILSDHFPTGLEETGMHLHAHPRLQLAPTRAHNDEGSASMVGVLHGNAGYGSSDWEHVLKEEIGWS